MAQQFLRQRSLSISMDDIKKRIERALPNIARRMRNELVLVCPVDTGILRNSIKVKSTDEGIVIWMANYGKFVEFGTPPHIIKPTEKEALKFEVGRVERLGKGGKKKIVFAKEVKHPGTRPQPFIRNTIQNKLKNIIIEELSR